jgi:CRISPR-associated protein Csb2
MAAYLRISFWMLDERFHGRGSGSALEWPPSPFRAWQALVASAEALERSGQHAGEVEAVRALEDAPPPLIVAPRSAEGRRVPTYVPNNDGDLVGRSRGSTSFADLRTAKVVATRHLDDARITYLWPAAVADSPERLESLRRAARSVSYLGWGMDLAVADADLCDQNELAALTGERWVPRPFGPNALRVPATGSLDDLEHRHREFSARMDGALLSPPAPPSVYRRYSYQREVVGVASSGPTFCLRDPNGLRMVAFDAARAGLRVAGMVRGATYRAALAQGWAPQEADRAILGHGSNDVANAPTPHLAFVPLPSIEFRGEGANPVVGPVRRVMLLPSSDEASLAADWAASGLAGVELVDESTGEIRAMLDPATPDDAVVRRYTDEATDWATVTPIVLPGYDDPRGQRSRLRNETDPERRRAILARLTGRIDGLIRKSIVQAGFGESLAARADVAWQDEPFWRGGTLACRYGRPSHAKAFPVLHVRIRWRDEHGMPLKVAGPICLGRGRFYGTGLFAGEG